MAAQFSIRLHPSYYERGFFNLGVATDRLIRDDTGPMTLRLSPENQEVQTIVTRAANRNGSPRIYPRADLRDWFHRFFKEDDELSFEILAPDRMRLFR